MSNKKLRNVRFEVPQMSEEMGGPVLFQTLEDAQKAAEEFGAYAIWKVRGSIFCPMGTGDIWSNESGEWLKVPKISGALSTMKDSHDSKHANRVCISAPFWGIGASPLMSTRCASRAGEFVA